MTRSGSDWTAPEIATAEREILDALLSRYEQSKAFGSTNGWRRDIIVPFTEALFPAAFAPTGFEIREALVAAGIRLAQRGALRSIPIRGQSEMHPKEFRIGPNEVAAAYAAAAAYGFTPLGDTLELLAERARAASQTIPSSWARDYLEAAAPRIAAGDLSPLRIEHRARVREEEGEWADALRAFAAVAQGAHGYERQLSERLFGNSKRFGDVRLRVAQLLRDADPQWAGLAAADIDADALFAAYDIRRRPVMIPCAGGVVLTRNGRAYALQDFWPVANLPGAWGPAVSEGLIAASRTQSLTITTVENEYAFLQYLDDAGSPEALVARAEVVVYTGGFPSPVITSALAQAAVSDSCLRFRHWGDADVGGLRIWLHLRQRIGRPVELFRTTRTWFLAQVGQREGQPLTALEVRHLQTLDETLAAMQATAAEESAVSDVAAARELVAVLLATGQKLEQERF